MIRRLLILFLLLLPFHAQAVVYVVGTAFNASLTNPTATMPTNIANDILILVLQSDNETIATPSGGWAEIDSQASMATGTTGPAQPGSLRMAVFWKRSTGGESTPTIADSGDHTQLLVMVIRGVITSGNPWDVETCGVQATTNTAVSWKSSGMAYGSNGGTLTTTTSGTFVVGFIANATDNAAAQATVQACATLNSVQEVTDNNSTLGTGGGISSFIGLKGNPGVVVDTSTNDATATLGTTSKYAMFIMALKPVTGTPIYVGTGEAVGSTSAVSPVFPLDVQANDIAILVFESSNQTITTPGGLTWTEIDAQASMATGTAVNAASLRMAIYWARLAGTEGGTTQTTTDTGDHNVAQIYVFRGCVTSGNPYDAAESVGFQSTSSITPAWQGMTTYGTNGSTVTTTAANENVLVIIANGIDFGNIQASVPVCASLANFGAVLTKDTNQNNNSAGTGGGFSVFAGEAVSSGTTVVDTGSNNFTAVLANTGKYAIAVIPLKPAATGPTAAQKAAFFQLFP